MSEGRRVVQATAGHAGGSDAGAGRAGVPLLTPPERRWECPSCDLKQVTHEARPHQRLHACAGMAGLTVPMVAAGTRAEHRVAEREDYIGSDVAQLAPDTGRPVMSVTTTREDGEDCTVFAPLATARGEA